MIGWLVRGTGAHKVFVVRRRATHTVVCGKGRLSTWAKTSTTVPNADLFDTRLAALLEYRRRRDAGCL